MIKFVKQFLMKTKGSPFLLTRNIKRPYHLLIFPAVAFGLGVWQIQRRSWKLSIIEHINNKSLEEPVTLNSEVVNNNETSEYTPVRLQGVFEHDKEIFLGPRTIIDDKIPRGAVTNKTSLVGYNVITPLRLIDGGGTVLVNRGWLPVDSMDPRTRPMSQIDGIVELEGLVRRTEGRGAMQPKNCVSRFRDKRRQDSPTYTVVSRKDIVVLSAMLGTLPFLVDAKFDKEVSDQNGPVGGQTRVHIRNEHMQYVVTWFGAGLAMSLAWLRWYR